MFIIKVKYIVRAVMEIKFLNLDKFQQIGKKSEDTLYFIFDTTWNDFGNFMRYDIFLEGSINFNSRYRILVLDSNNNFIDENKLLNISDISDFNTKKFNFWGFADTLDFYDNLGKKFNSKKLKVILDELHDVTLTGIDELQKNLKKGSNNCDFQNPFAVNFETKEEELIDNGLLRYGYDTFELAEFCKKIKIPFECLISKELNDKDLTNFKNYFKKFINGEYRDDINTTNVIKEFICRLENVDNFLSLFKEDEIVNFVGMIISDTNYYLKISALAPRNLGSSDQSLIEKICDIQEILRVKEAPEGLGQYTSLETLDYTLPKAILNSEKDRELNSAKSNEEDCPSIRLTNGNQLNDPMEGKVLFSVLGIDSVEYENTMNYLASATKVRDNLPMWKQYGDDARGVFTVFDRTFCEDLVKHNYIYKICYLDPNTESVSFADSKSEEESKINEDIQSLKKMIKAEKENPTTLLKWSRYMDNLKFLFKKSEYKYEEEYRILVNQQNLSKIEPEHIDGINFGYKLYTYIYKDGDCRLPMKYSEIIVGPKSLNNINYIAEYIKFLDKNITVTSSEINYR